MAHLKPNVRPYAPYDLENDENALSLVPIIFNHGITGSSRGYTAMLSELASHGYIVFSLDTHSGACGYTEKANGEPVLFDTSDKFMDYEARNRQVQKRADEVSAVIDELSEINYLQDDKVLGKIFPPAVYLDLKKMIVGGHSFGAITAILSGVQDSRVKATLALDPWLYPISQPDAWMSWAWRRAGKKPL